MAKETQEIIYSIKLDIASTAEGLKSFTQSAKEATKASSDLKNSQSESEEAAKRQETAAKKTSEALKAEEGSIAALRESNKKLTQERNNTSLSTEAGKKKVQELNAQLDKNNAAIKQNVDAYTKQKIGIGDYTGALDKLVPGLGATINGFKGMTTSAMAFIATPLGAVLAAVAAAIALVAQYFTRTEAGGDLLAKRMDQLSAVFNVLLDRAAMLGDALVKLFTGDFIGAANDTKEAFSGVADEMEREVKIAGELADILDELEDRERTNKVALSSSTLEIKRLVAESKNRNLSEKEKIALLQQATDLEIQSNAKTKQIQLDKLKAATKQIEMDFNQFGITKKKTESELEYAQRIVDNADLTGAARDQVAEAIIALNQVEGESLVIQEKINNQIDANIVKNEAKKQKLIELAEKQAEADKKEFDALDKKMQKSSDLEAKIDANRSMRESKDADSRAKSAMGDMQANLAKQVALGNQANAEREVKERLLKQDKEDNEKKVQNFTKSATAIIDQLSGFVNSFFAAKLGQYKAEENALAVNLANQKTINNTAYTEELADLKKKYENGTLSKEDYDKGILAANQKFQAANKEAEIAQSKALNEVKRKEFETNKKNQIFQAVADGAKAVLGAFAATPGGIIIKGIAAAAAGIFAGIQIAQIKKSEFVPSTFFEGGYTGAGNPRQESTKLGKRWYTYHRDEYITPSRVLNSREGMYYVNKLENLRKRGRNTFSVPGFADGGFAFADQQNNSVNLSDTNRLLKELLNKPNQPVLVLQDFEATQSERDQVRTKADLL